MDFASLTNYQLYEIIQNQKLDVELRTAANQEFNSRNLSIDKIEEIVFKHEKAFKPDKNEPLSIKLRLLIILFPFLVPIQSLFASKWLAQGHKRKWKEYWLYLSIGYLFWTVIVILIARHYLINNN